MCGLYKRLWSYTEVKGLPLSLIHKLSRLLLIQNYIRKTTIWGKVNSSNSCQRSAETVEGKLDLMSVGTQVSICCRFSWKWGLNSNHCPGTHMFLDLMESPVNMRNGHVKVTRREVEGSIRQLWTSRGKFSPFVRKGRKQMQFTLSLDLTKSRPLSHTPKFLSISEYYWLFCYWLWKIPTQKGLR